MNEALKLPKEPSLHLALLNEVLKCSDQAVVLLNTEAEILFFTPGIQLISGYEPEELLGKTAFDFFHPLDLPSARKHHQYLMDQIENDSASLIQIRNKHQQMIWIDVVAKNLLHLPGITAIFVLLKKSSDAGVEERKLAQAIADAKEQEREFLATELHDNINQIITMTKLLVDTACTSPHKEELLQLSSQNLQRVAEEIRTLSYSLVSYDLREFGLTYAVHTLLSTVAKACAVQFQIHLSEKAVTVLTMDQQLHLYRIIQEGINNIIRHADATQAEVALTRQEDMIYLLIADNGKGISMNGIKRGIGLSSITNRVKLLKGQFHVQAHQGTGTAIAIYFPV